MQIQVLADSIACCGHGAAHDPCSVLSSCDTMPLQVLICVPALQAGAPETLAAVSPGQGGTAHSGFAVQPQQLLAKALEHIEASEGMSGVLQHFRVRSDWWSCRSVLWDL